MQVAYILHKGPYDKLRARLSEEIQWIMTKSLQIAELSF
jgi:effector-binding domain-containing protein